MSSEGRVRPVDSLVAGYNALLAAAWLVASTSPRAAWWAFLAAGIHLAACFVPAWRARRESPGIAADLYPLLALAAFFEELGPLLPLLHAGTHDAAIEALDRRVFGFHLNATWMPSMPYVWLSEAMFGLYFAYYALIYLPPLWLALGHRREALADTLLRLMATYLACYVLYLAYPVVGPRLTSEPYRGPLTAGPMYRLVHAVLARGEADGTAFPSSHVAGSVAIALTCRRWLPGVWARLTAVMAAGVAAATVYTGNHYAIDVLAGLFVASAVQTALPALRRALSSAPAPAEADIVPVLPASAPWGERPGAGGV